MNEINTCGNMTGGGVGMPKQKNEDSTTRKVLDVLVLCIAEFIGTAIILFMGCMGCASTVYPIPTYVFAGFSFGLTVAYAIQMFVHISGAHFNPALTIAAWIMGTLKWQLIPFYILAQIVGGLAGYGLLVLLIPSSYSNGLCVTVPHSEVSVVQALFLELVGTALLVMIVCTLWDPRNHGYADSLSIKTGLMLAPIFIALAPFSGGAFNTARGFAPSVYHNIWTSHWIYWVGPTLGGFVGASLYKYIFVTGLSNVRKKDN